MNNTLRVLLVYLALLAAGQAGAVGLGLMFDKVSTAVGIAVFIPVYYAMYWVAWRLALWIADRSPQTAAGSRDGGGTPLQAAVWLLAPAVLALDLCD
jgi:hypothetical protein